MNPVVSVILCTRNRFKYLVPALESIGVHELGPELCEIIVVDNASSDSTKEYVCSRARDDPRLHYVLEPIIGLSRARNTGIQAARGKHVAFLDDDAVAEPGWLSQIPIAFEKGGTDVGCVAGKVTAIWSIPRPPWLHDSLLGYISVLDYAPEPIWLQPHQIAVGANVAYLRHALLQAGGFSPALGRKGTSLLSNEEILLQRQLNRIGYRTYYDPRMAIRHNVSAERLSKSWFRRRAYWQGVSDALLETQLESTPFSRALERRLRRIASIAKRPKELLSLAHWGNDPVAFATQCVILTKLGYSLAILHMGR